MEKNEPIISFDCDTEIIENDNDDEKIIHQNKNIIQYVVFPGYICNENIVCKWEF